MTSADPPTAGRRQWVALAATVVVGLVLAARQQAFVRQYAVDVMYWDAWELYDPLFHGQGWVASFDQQHGPHRQGLGGWVIRAMATRGRWDTRNDAAAVSVALIAAAAVGVWLAWRCGVRGLPLVAVTVAYLNVRQYSMFVAAANPAHGAIPLVLLTACCLAWFIRSTARRLSAVVGLTFLLIFTGFGLFAGLVTPPVLAVDGWRAARAGDRRRAAAHAVAVAAVAVAWGLFAVNWRPDPASPSFRLLWDRPLQYAVFGGLLLGNYAGAIGPVTSIPWATVAVGLTIAAAGAAVCVIRGVRLVRRGAAADPATAAVFCLAAFGLLFELDATVGRAPDGWLMAVAPRYVTLCVPTGLAVLLHLAADGRRWARRLAVVAGAGLACGTLTLSPGDVADARWLHDGCLRWRAAYLRTHDVAAADRLADFKVHPPPLDDRLRYLADRRLNLFDPAAFGPPPPPAPR